MKPRSVDFAAGLDTQHAPDLRAPSAVRVDLVAPLVKPE
jgi:hypothetical protein